jgi:chromosome segregation ATPase
MEDSELRQQFQLMNQQFESMNQRFESIDRRFESIDQRFQSMTTLIVNVKESLEREIGGLGERIDRMDVRLGKIAAGAGYVTRLVEWSEKQDRFQLDILERVQKLETRLDKLQKNGQ